MICGSARAAGGGLHKLMIDLNDLETGQLVQILLGGLKMTHGPCLGLGGLGANP